MDRGIAALSPSRTPDLDHAKGRYRVRFAREEADLDHVFGLRFEVFNLELGEGLPESVATRRDRDEFDAQCQHLMVIEEKTGRVVGTYRLQIPESAREGVGFYAATEFDLSTIPDEVLENTMELGRACVAREHRNRVTLFLLWKGLAAYSLKNDKRYYFGCSSLTGRDPEEGLWALDHLRRCGHVHPEIRVTPLPGFECAAPDHRTRDDPYPIPTLFSTYLRHGAKVLGLPAIDRVFGTIDFLTMLDVAAMEPRLFRMFART